MWHPRNEEIDALLKRDSRAKLPFRHLLQLYLNPFALFKDASSGPLLVRQNALRYNRAMRWMLLPYMRRWLAIAVAFFTAIEPTQALASEASLFIIPAAAFAVGCCIAVVVMLCAGCSYLLLGTRR
jgi:hypothetical protein